MNLLLKFWNTPFAGAALLLAGCAAPSSYMGVSFTPGAAPAEIQRLAARAMSGDREAQIQLGSKFEGGEGFEKNLAKALTLYELASKTSAQRFSVYVPAANGGAAAMANINLITEYDKGIIEQAILRRNSLRTAMAKRNIDLRDFHNE